MRPKPRNQNTTVPRAKSMKFFITMLPAFLARVSPVSTMANPGCMKYTRIAPKSTQMVSTDEYLPSGSAAMATAGVARAARSSGHFRMTASIFFI